MWNLVIGLSIGVIVVRYIFPIFDMLLETLQYKITNKCTDIQIDTQLKSLEFETIVNKGNELTPAIGFLAGQNYNDIDEEQEDDDQDELRLGFRGNKDNEIIILWRI